MRSAKTLVACLAVVGCAGMASAQAPKPGPEHAKLGYFVGKWKSEGVMKENPFMPAGKMTMKDDCEWFEGGFAVVCNSEGKSPTGPTKAIAIMSYSPEEQAYLYYSTDNTGMIMSSVPKGTIAGDTWTYLDESKMGGQMVKSRYTIKTLSPTSYTWVWEMEHEGQWMALAEGTSKKN